MKGKFLRSLKMCFSGTKCSLVGEYLYGMHVALVLITSMETNQQPKTRCSGQCARLDIVCIKSIQYGKQHGPDIIKNRPTTWSSDLTPSYIYDENKASITNPYRHPMLLHSSLQSRHWIRQNAHQHIKE